MSKGLNNPKAFSTQDEAESSPITPAQITDAADFPHTGLIKALSLGMRGNYATTGFNATAVTDDDVTFADGVVFRDGEEVAVTGSTIVIGTTTGTTKSYTTGYHLVVNQTGTTTLTVRPPTAVDAVPAYNDDDVIIAILAYTGNDPMQIQYLTINKNKNSLSIARNNSGTYTEMGTITCDTDSLDIVTTNSNADIILDPHGTGDVKLGNLAIDGDQTVGSGQDGYALIYTHSNTKAALAAIPVAYTDSNAISAVEGEATLDLTGDVTIAAGKDLTVDTSTLHVDSANDRVGIGTASPTTTLHVKTSGAGDAAIIESTEAGATDAPDLVLYRNSSSPAVSDEIGSIRFRGKDSSAGDKDYNRITSVIRDNTAASADADLIFQSLSNSVEIEMMKISRIDGIVINEIGASYIDTRIEGDTDANLFFTDASVDKVGIGTNTPTQKLTVGGSIKSTSYHGSVVEITGSGLPVGSPPATVSLLNLDSDTHRTIIADTQASAPNPPNALTLNLPAASGTHQGWEMKIICKNNAGGVDDLVITPAGSDELISATGAVIGNNSSPLSLTTGKIYTVIHISATQYMAIQLN